MVQFLGFGNGSDGDVTISSNTTEVPIDSTAITDADTIRLDATNPSFSANQMVLVHQSQNAGAGGWEVNQIKSYAAGFITPQITLANTYVAGAQVRVLPQYKSLTINSGITYTAKAWNGSVGGIIACLCVGLINNVGAISADACGFRGGGPADTSGVGFQGEGSAGVGSRSTSANGNGGGGGSGRASGGSGGNAGAGVGGNSGNASPVPGAAGNSVGSSNCTVMLFGGAGGGGGNTPGVFGRSGTGGNGGGIVFCMASQFTNSGTISCAGANGTNVTGSDGSGGSDGAAGCILIKTGILTIGTGISALGATGVSNFDGGGANGAAPGGNGYVRLECCSLLDAGNDSSPMSSRAVGGLTWCFVPGTMI